mmetsp:Transcript_27164/g.71979  ORF Transcript_27164/g.71979 Transcript_27164/m.71979 type:complete len:292 (+) Transcript_27164:314-1189(+)
MRSSRGPHLSVMTGGDHAVHCGLRVQQLLGGTGGFAGFDRGRLLGRSILKDLLHQLRPVSVVLQLVLGLPERANGPRLDVRVLVHAQSVVDVGAEAGGGQRGEHVDQAVREAVDVAGPAALQRGLDHGARVAVLRAALELPVQRLEDLVLVLGIVGVLQHRLDHVVGEDVAAQRLRLVEHLLQQLLEPLQLGEARVLLLSLVRALEQPADDPAAIAVARDLLRVLPQVLDDEAHAFSGCHLDHLRNHVVGVWRPGHVPDGRGELDVHLLSRVRIAEVEHGLYEAASVLVEC